MGRDDWYRNKSWNDEIEAQFRAKLARSRSGRPQYIEIQAGYLADGYPLVSLQLIEEYFDTGDDMFVPAALCVRARAMVRLERIKEAILAFKQALDWESLHPNFITTARIDYPLLVAKRRIGTEYEDALSVLTDRFKPSDFSFPATRYHWNGCQALIRAQLGQREDVRHFAEHALAAAIETESPFRYHRNLGVVRDTSDDFGQRVKRLARPSRVRSLFRLLRGGYR